jgi:hypothetical protein
MLTGAQYLHWLNSEAGFHYVVPPGIARDEMPRRDNRLRTCLKSPDVNH